MKVVLNTSPIIFLAKIDALDLLNRCFSELFVPDAVLSELQHLPLPEFIRQAAVSSHGKAFVEGAMGRLHRGEEVIPTGARQVPPADC